MLLSWNQQRALYAAWAAHNKHVVLIVVWLRLKLISKIKIKLLLISYFQDFFPVIEVRIIIFYLHYYLFLRRCYFSGSVSVEGMWGDCTWILQNSAIHNLSLPLHFHSREMSQSRTQRLTFIVRAWMMIAEAERIFQILRVSWWIHLRYR